MLKKRWNIIQVNSIRSINILRLLFSMICHTHEFCFYVCKPLILSYYFWNNGSARIIIPATLLRFCLSWKRNKLHNFLPTIFSALYNYSLHPIILSNRSIQLIIRFVNIIIWFSNKMIKIYSNITKTFKYLLII